jgi:hypothetical protein
MSVYSDMKFAQDEDELNALKAQANMEDSDHDYGYDEFKCEGCLYFDKCSKDADERCEIWYEEGRD